MSEGAGADAGRRKERGSATRDPLLVVKNASKAYGVECAILDVDFDLFAGEVHALVGENGAGKSTLCKALSGATTLTSGTMTLGGRELRLTRPADGLAAGVFMVYQETSLVPTMTVAQNIVLGKERFWNGLRALTIEAQQLLQSLSFNVDPMAYVETLGAAQKQMVEIARAVYHQARVIIFDEPTATLTPEEKQHFFDLLDRLRDRQNGVIFISHALEEALEHADRITVLRDGRRVLHKEARSLTRGELVRAMIGREDREVHSRKRRGSLRDEAEGEAPFGRKRKVLTVENVSMGTMVRNMSFSLYAGEVTGIAGLVGSGRTEIAKVICGLQKRDIWNGGNIYLEGRPVRYRVPKDAVDDGIVYITEDRKQNGFFETMTIAENIYMGHLSTSAGGRFLLSRAEAARLSKEWSARLLVRSINEDPKIIELSGGNQQKVVIAKSLVQKPKIVFLDEPTRGVDIGSIEEIHRYIRSLSDEGIAVVVISSYLPEILRVSDRILVARLGRIVEEFRADDATEEKIMFAAVH